jgi:hypothetical protein
MAAMPMAGSVKLVKESPRKVSGPRLPLAAKWLCCKEVA